MGSWGLAPSEPDPRDQENFREFQRAWVEAEKWKEVPPGLSLLLPYSCRFAWALLHFAGNRSGETFRLLPSMVKLVTEYPAELLGHILPLLGRAGILAEGKITPDAITFRFRPGVVKSRGWTTSFAPPAKRSRESVSPSGTPPDRESYQHGAGISV